MDHRFQKLPNLAGDRISRHVCDELVVDEFGNEFGARKSHEVLENFDGAEELRERIVRQLLSCGHVHEIGAPLAKCDGCSEKAGRPAYVCADCSVICPVTGQALCRQCTKLGPDGRRYSPNGLTQAKKMGLFDRVQNAPICTPSRGSSLTRFISQLPDWW